MTMPLWFSNLLFWSAQVALLVLAAGFLPRFFQIREPRVLLLYCRALLVVSFLLPFLQPWHRTPNLGEIIGTPDLGGTPLPTPVMPSARWHMPTMSLIAEIVSVVIAAGIIVRLSVLALGLFKLRRLRDGSSLFSLTAHLEPIPQATHPLMDSRVEFRLSAEVDSPVTFGLAAPIILLPERFLHLEPRFQSAIACHELVHVRRHDWAHHLVEEMVRAVFWFHPAIAWVISRLRLAREQVVDLEVVRLTNARKTYLEALLEFTNSRTTVAAIPAPPFLAERQLVERIALMLKEVHMSRRKLILSLGIISCGLALVVALSARSFPLKRAPLQSAPQTGVIGGVADGVSGGSVSGVSTHAPSDIPDVDYSTIWIDTVKRGSMVRQVRGLGNLVRAETSGNVVARIALPPLMTGEVKPNQNATVDTRKGLVNGHVVEINSVSSGETHAVYIALDGPLPEGVGPDSLVDGTIDIEKLDNVLQVSRPVQAAANSTGSLFKIINDGNEAQRVTVKFGRSGVNAIEVLHGLQVGDKVILSDMSAVDSAERVHLTHEQHVRK